MGTSYSQSDIKLCEPNSPPNSVDVDPDTKDAIVKIKMSNPGNSRWIWAGDTRANGSISQDGYVIFNLGKLPPGAYKFHLFINGGSLNCSSFITIPDQGQGGTTTGSSSNIKFSPENPTKEDIIIATITSLPQDGEYTLSIYNPGTPQNTEQPIQCKQSVNKEVTFLIQPLTSGGTRNVSVYKRDLKRPNECGSIGSKIARGQITISSPLPTPTSKAVPAPCATLSPEGKCTGVDTGLGIVISTEPQAFVRSIFSLVLGISGGVALILIIISGYKFLTSAGNPETIKDATGQLTSAIIGLLFIIFSFVILQVIGFDILRIPGFGE